MQGNIAITPVAVILFFATIGISYYALERKPQILNEWMLRPWAVFHQGNYKLLLTHGFIHANYLHLIFNMIVFWFFAFPLERTTGSLRFLIIYLGAMILGAYITSYKKKTNDAFRSLGASGALSGVLLSFVLYYPKAVLLIFFIIPMPAWLFGILFLVFSYYAGKPPESHDEFSRPASSLLGGVRGQWARFRYQYPLVDQINSNLARAWEFIKRKTAFIDHESHFWGAICGAGLTLLTDFRLLGGIF